MALFQCFDSAVYIDKKSGKEIKDKEAWDKTNRDFFDPKKRPIVGYSQKDDSVEVKPVHF